MNATSLPGLKASTTDTGGVTGFTVLACALTWGLTVPVALAWTRHEPPSPFAIATVGLSAFGPLIAALIFAARRGALRETFGRWRTRLGWVALALVAAPTLHMVATLAYAALGGHPSEWVHLPATPEHVAALVVFPLGEEFGWRGFAHPRLVARFGLVKGSLILGLVWGIWHLAYSITPEAAGFDAFAFTMTMVDVFLYSLPIAWVFERSNRSMAVAIAFHAGAHLDHLERAPRTEMGLHVTHLAVVAVAAGVAFVALSRRGRPLVEG